uniref:Uncharacterized protein n=1 Tax=Arundo donax TaxID=35708 RepID=A0A0A8YRG8_ARUDO
MHQHRLTPIQKTTKRMGVSGLEVHLSLCKFNNREKAGLYYAPMREEHQGNNKQHQLHGQRQRLSDGLTVRASICVRQGPSEQTSWLLVLDEKCSLPFSLISIC